MMTVDIRMAETDLPHTRKVAEALNAKYVGWGARATLVFERAAGGRIHLEPQDAAAIAVAQARRARPDRASVERRLWRLYNREGDETVADLLRDLCGPEEGR